MSTISVLRAAISLGVAVVGLLVVAERLYLVNGAQYPRFLAKDVGPVRLDDIDRRRGFSCNGEPLEVYAKTDYWVLRCGFAYFEGNTVISYTDPFANPGRQGGPL